MEPRVRPRPLARWRRELANPRSLYALSCATYAIGGLLWALQLADAAAATVDEDDDDDEEDSDEDLPLDAYRCSRTQHSICNSLIYALLEFICLCMCFIIFILVSKCGILSFIAVARSLKTRNTRQKS